MVDPMSAVFLIRDPLHEYADRLITLIHRQHGYRAVCFFTDKKLRSYLARNHPVLTSDAVLASHDISRDDMRGFARRIRAEHEVAGVVPYSEECVSPAAELDHALGLRWNDSGVVRRFRDKFAMKEHIRRVDPSLRMNASLRVYRAHDVFHAGAARFDRYVIKPNDGFGNRNIGFFTATTGREEVETFMARLRGTPLVLEEYVEGREYFVNGQTDERGEPHVLGIFEYERVAANGRENLDVRVKLVHTDTSVFGEIAQYTKRMLRATGLRRSPFHLELKIDGNGPCLLEVAARLGGHRTAFVVNALHGGGLDLFALAAHYYLSDRPYGSYQTRWDIYDASDMRIVNGIATRTGIEYAPGAIEAVEGLPTFHMWAKKPVLGRGTAVTRDVMTMPWGVVLLGPRDQVNLDADEAGVRTQFTREAPPFCWSLMTARAKWLEERAARFIRWHAGRLRRHASASGGPGRSVTVRHKLRRFLTYRCPRVLDLPVRLRFDMPGHALSPAGFKAAADITKWAHEYLTQPHPDLGRKGPVCPFAAKSLATNLFLIAVHEEVFNSEREVRDVLLSHARVFQRRYPIDRHGASVSLLILMPNMPPDLVVALDVIHNEAKTYLMADKIMVGTFHPRSDRPAMWNVSFHVQRSPIPCFAVRHMVVQDVIFVGHNRKAMLTYNRHFGQLYAQGLVSNEFSYIDLYHAACARFSLTPAG
jgi:hypothetical protein